MITKIDWLQFSIPHDENLFFGALRQGNLALAKVSESIPELVGGDMLEDVWLPTPAPFPYKFGLEVIPHSLYLQWGGVNNHILVRFTGTGCDLLRKMDLVEDYAGRFSDHVSRIDFAVDMETTVSPPDFVAKRKAGRVQTLGSIDSQTGQTRTIGSRKSDFYCRVYRYAPPHPRSHMLRAEVEVKGKAAQAAALIVKFSGEMKACLSVHERLHWEHPIWQPDASVPPISVSRASDKVGRGELLWIEKQVIPALTRYHSKGLLNLHELAARLEGQARSLDTCQ